ncbi:hypothetical protein [Allocoleopsis sp.]|uniref:hypothetical protein n=1 Tax=Allocoleopsis sp. TaxID=3088169 RepID=UPI002FD0D2EC
MGIKRKHSRSDASSSASRSRNSLATFSRTANFDAAVADPELDKHESAEDEYYALTPEEEDEGDAIIEELAIAGDIESLEAILGTVEDSLLDDVEEGILTQEEAEDLYEGEREYLEALLDEVADLEEIPEDELVDEYEEYNDADDYDEDIEAIEEEGIAILEQLSPEELDEVVDVAIAELEEDSDSIEAELEAGNITEEEAEELFEQVALAYQGLEEDYYALTEGYDEEDYYEEDPIVDAVGALEEEVLYQRRQNQRLQAEFSQARTAQDVSDTLDDLERQASNLVQMGVMPYAVFEREFGQWESERDRFAGFSMCCEQNGTDYASELAHKQRTIEMFAEFAEGGAPLYSPEMLSYEAEFSADELSEMDALDVQARRNVLHLLGRN